jgi:menin
VEDRRGQEAGVGDEEDSWLYLKGNAVYCSKHMAIAAIVNSINYTIHGHGMMYSSELIQIQQRLLWKLYDAGHLKKFLSGLGKFYVNNECFKNNYNLVIYLK